MRLSTRLESLHRRGQQHLLRGGLKGLERESLRISAGNGCIAQTPHPSALGSALTHPWITTDYSEALIELITPPFAEAADTLSFLDDIHSYVYQSLDDELLLATSMPIGLTGDENIPIARFGSSNIGMMKHIYRKGLSYRYGRTMQSIAGVHFNYSINEALWPILQDLEQDKSATGHYISESYFGVIRNIHRHGWLLIYLFGNSPAICKSFFHGRESLASHFAQLDADTLYRPAATSLRMSDIGYRNDNQTSLDISFNHVDEYIASLDAATRQPYPPYEKIGVKVNGEYRQLNPNILQIENEYYSSVRPKQIARSGEKPTIALRKRGVRYIELRALDLLTFQPAGVSLDEMRFIETFVLLCLLLESPPLDSDEKAECNRNSLSVACCARGREFRLLQSGQWVPLAAWAEQLLNAMLPVADILDNDDPAQPYRKSIEQHQEAITEPELTLSAQVFKQMRESGESFAEFALRHSRQHAAYWKHRNISRERLEALTRDARASLQRQAEIEASDQLPFDTFLENYWAQT